MKALKRNKCPVIRCKVQHDKYNRAVLCMKVVKEKILSSHHKKNYFLFHFFNAVSI